MGSLIFPDSPTNARVLTKDERAKAVRRIKVCNHSSSHMLGLSRSLDDEGKPNGSGEQALQKGTVSTFRFIYRIAVVNLWAG